MNKIELIKEHKEDTLAGLNALLDKLYSLKEYTNEHGEIKEGLEADDKWKDYVLNTTKDISKYEKLRHKIQNNDFNFTITEINDIALVFFYLKCTWEKQIELLQKAITESDKVFKELTSSK